jgi:hypothetical protein
VDRAGAMGPAAFFGPDNTVFLIAVVFLFMVLRPVLFGL